MVAHHLQEVLVAGDHHDLVAPFYGLSGQRGDHVVGLEAGGVDDGQAEGVADPPHVGQLHDQVVLHPPAVRLVLLVLGVAEGRRGQVEGDADPLRLLVLVELAQHGGEAVGGAGGQAVGGGQAADREVRAVELRAPVDEVDGVFAAGHVGSYLD